MHTHHAHTVTRFSSGVLSNARTDRASERERKKLIIIQLKIHWQLVSLVCALCTLRKWRRWCVRSAAKDGAIWQFESIDIRIELPSANCHCVCQKLPLPSLSSSALPFPYALLQHGNHRMHRSYGSRYRRAKCLQFELNGWAHAKIIINRLSHF